MAEKVEKVSEPQDVIVYDHNLKRYTVNGKVLEEEGSQEQSTSEPSKVPLPPPPPKKTAQSGSPPPPPPNRKNRLPTPAT